MHSPLTWLGTGWLYFGVGERKAACGEEVSVMDESKDSTISLQQANELNRQLGKLVWQFAVLLDMLEKRRISLRSKSFPLTPLDQPISSMLTGLERCVDRLTICVLTKIKAGPKG